MGGGPRRPSAGSRKEIARLAAAEDLAAVPGTPSVHTFLTEPIGAYIQQGVHRASNAYRAIEESVWESLDAQDALKVHLIGAHEDGHELTEVETDPCAGAEHELDQVEPLGVRIARSFLTKSSVSSVVSARTMFFGTLIGVTSLVG